MVVVGSNPIDAERLVEGSTTAQDVVELDVGMAYLVFQQDLGMDNREENESTLADLPSVLREMVVAVDFLWIQSLLVVVTLMVGCPASC